MQNTIEENILNKKKLFALISNWNNHPIIKKEKWIKAVHNKDGYDDGGD